MLPLQDTKTSGNIAYQNILLILVTFYLFFVQLFGRGGEQFTFQYSLVPYLVDFSNIFSLIPFITSLFLHGGLLHIAGNMLFLWVFGDNIEERLGYFYIPFYILGGIIAGLSQYLLNPNSQVPILGASGAVAAVLGAYLVWYPRHTVRTLVVIFFFITIINIPAYLLLAYWFVLQIFNGVASLGYATAETGGVAYLAHVGGFIFGVLFAFLKSRPKSLA